MSDQTTCEDTSSVISLPESEDGVMHSDSRVGQTTGQSGPVRARVNRSRQRDNAKASMTPDTYGLNGSGLSASVVLSQCLASRLIRRLRGSTLFRESWRVKVTPSGRQLWAHTASGHRTRGNDCTGQEPWPTVSLNDQATLASWTTPQAHDTTGRSETQKEKHGTKHGCACLVNEARGIILTGSPAETVARGQLNPDFSRWLMGYPAEWGCCAATATQSSRRSRQRS